MRRAIDWDAVIRTWAHDNGWGFRYGLLWLSQRDCLRTAVELLGYDAEFAKDLGDVLHRHGYKVPPVVAGLVELGVGINAREVVKDDQRTHIVKFSPELDEYLSWRAAGKTRTEIANEHGVTTATISSKLRRWGIRGVGQELDAIERFKQRVSV